MNGRPLIIPSQMSSDWATQTRRATEVRLRRSSVAIARSRRFLADYPLHEVRGLATSTTPAPGHAAPLIASATIRDYSGIFPCFRVGPTSRFVRHNSSPLISHARVSCGSITASM